MRICDRAKDLVKSGGEWISSVDLENELMGHSAVAEAAVIAVPDEKWGERPLAAVVLRDGMQASSRRAPRAPRRRVCQVAAARPDRVHRSDPAHRDRQVQEDRPARAVRPGGGLAAQRRWRPIRWRARGARRRTEELEHSPHGRRGEWQFSRLGTSSSRLGADASLECRDSRSARAATGRWPAARPASSAGDGRRRVTGHQTTGGPGAGGQRRVRGTVAGRFSGYARGARGSSPTAPRGPRR